MPPLLPILLDILPAVLLSAVVLVLGNRLAPPSRERNSSWPSLAIGGGYLAGHLALRGWRGWAPRESTDWIAVCALGALAIGGLAWTRRSGRRSAFLLRWLVGSTAAWAVVGKVLLRQDSALTAWSELALIGLAAAIVWSVLETQATSAGVGLAALLCVVATGTSIALLLAESALLAQLAGGLAAALGAAVGVRVLFRAPLQIRAAVPVVVITLLALLLAGSVYARLPTASALLLGAAPLSVAVAHAPGVGRLPRPLRLAAPTLFAMLPIALALLLTHQAVPAWDGY